MEQKNKLCPHCQKEISEKATKCPHCQSNLLSFTKRPIKGNVWVVGIVIFIIIFSFAILSGNQNNQQSSLTQINEQTSICSGFQPSQAKTADFKQLDKNPDSFKGTIAKFTGQIIQIQESNGQGVIRLAVTKEDYGWSSNDIIFVNYNGHNDFVENDIVNVYGVMQGSYTYTSQAKFKITLPSMEACSIEKYKSTSSPKTDPLILESKKIQENAPAIGKAIENSVPKSWHTIATFSGQTQKNTSTFSIKGTQWRIKWEETGSNYFSADAESPDGSGSYCSIANLVGSGSDSTYCYKPGTYYISVSASNPWIITVEDYY